MNDKTCNDCAKCKSKKVIAVCEHKGITAGEVPACSNFESAKVTNGDKIRQMSNRELVDFIREVTDDRICDYCVNRNKICEFRRGEDICTKGMIAWLNAPAGK
jgi:hypothetical protein